MSDKGFELDFVFTFQHLPADYRKQFSCKKFKQGHCEHGSDCCYSHEGITMETTKPADTMEDSHS